MDEQKEEALMSAARDEELLRAVAGAAKLKRLWLKVAQLFNPIKFITRIQSRLGQERTNLMERTNDHR